MRYLFAVAFGLVFTGCASLNSVSLTPVPAERSHQVEAEADRWIIFALNFDNDFVDTMTKNLSRRCPNGKISGILTKDESINYFIGLVVKRRVVASGYCDRATTDVGLAAHKGKRMINSVDEKPEADDGEGVQEQ